MSLISVPEREARTTRTMSANVVVPSTTTASSRAAASGWAVDRPAVSSSRHMIISFFRRMEAVYQCPCENIWGRAPYHQQHGRHQRKPRRAAAPVRLQHQRADRLTDLTCSHHLILPGAVG